MENHFFANHCYHARPSAASFKRFMISGPNSACSEEYQIKWFLVAVWIGMLVHMECMEKLSFRFIRSFENFAALHRTTCRPRLPRRMMMILCVVPFGDYLMQFEECIKCSFTVLLTPASTPSTGRSIIRSPSFYRHSMAPVLWNFMSTSPTMHVSDVTLNVTLQRCPKLKKPQFYPQCACSRRIRSMWR